VERYSDLEVGFWEWLPIAAILLASVQQYHENLWIVWFFQCSGGERIKTGGKQVF